MIVILDAYEARGIAYLTYKTNTTQLAFTLRIILSRVTVTCATKSQRVLPK